MAAQSSSTLTISILLMLLFSTLSSASDMSIINYDETHIPRRTDDEVAALYESWLIELGKSYNALGEKDKRFQIFKDNLKYIDEQNSVPNKRYKLGLTKFADLTNEEYRSIYLGYKSSGNRRKLSRKESDRYLPKVGDNLPESVDWRERGALVDVKDQGNCGSSWAFSAIASIESLNALKTGDLISLSEQELIDCDRSYNDGCNGGLVDNAFEFVIKNGGVDSEKDYPYQERDGFCDQTRRKANIVKIDNFIDIPAYNETFLRNAIIEQPVSIAVEAGSRDFQHYKSGIFTGRCGTAVDHAVVTVGYGTENGMDYWIVRNSWGANWGEDGYIRMQRNVASSSGLCGIAMEPSYPVKTGPNPPKPAPSPPSPVKPPSQCDDYYQCPAGNTCCCTYLFRNSCLSWSCCPLEGATCCEDHYSCCPHDYPVCNSGTCSISKGNPLGVKAMKRILAKPIGAIGSGGKKSSS